ncbi:MAG: hypothetical protein MZV64_30695 [Ignavibacteriales bacterium]|nr:hypothetical protein [Ignavibacteriales bacterium]
MFLLAAGAALAQSATRPASAPPRDATADVTDLLHEFLAKVGSAAMHQRFWADDVIYVQQRRHRPDEGRHPERHAGRGAREACGGRWRGGASWARRRVLGGGCDRCVSSARPSCSTSGSSSARRASPTPPSATPASSCGATGDGRWCRGRPHGLRRPAATHDSPTDAARPRGR